MSLPFITGMYAATEKLDQAKSLTFSDTLIDEILGADTIVIAVPMHNFGVPPRLKAWIDHVVRVGERSPTAPMAHKVLLTKSV